MKKVININFQGTIVPIEESSYELLQQYIESLRRYFANEEGKDEIINDIESRISELFQERLKGGSTCITDDDVNVIIKNMGRPEDFEEAEAENKETDKSESSQKYKGFFQGDFNWKGKRLYRDENNKILGGVCSGIAAYFGIDPVIVRILFLISGIGFLAYILLWMFVPGSNSLENGVRKRLYRNPDEKIIGGVCSGIGSYFDVNPWLPRFIFLIPFITFFFRWGHIGPLTFPNFLSFSFSPGSFIIYIILWLVIPEATTTSEKLEMKGEKVDLNSIKNSVLKEMKEVGERVGKMGQDVGERVGQMGKEAGTFAKEKSTDFGKEIHSVSHRSSGILGKIIITIFKIFLYFILGVIALAIIVALFSIAIAAIGLFPLKNFVLTDGWQTVFAWGTLIFFVAVPVIGIITFIIRRFARVKGTNKLMRYSFIGLWILGIVCFISLITSIGRDFKSISSLNPQPIILQNAGVKYLEVTPIENMDYRRIGWFHLEPFGAFGATDDTAFIGNVRIKITKSPTDSFQITVLKMANGRTRRSADTMLSLIKFNVSQSDSIVMMDRAITINTNDKFRNQNVEVTIAVPAGHYIKIDKNFGYGNRVRLGPFFTDNDHWFYNNDNENDFEFNYGEKYLMKEDGLYTLGGKRSDDRNDDWSNSGDNNTPNPPSNNNNENYRYDQNNKIDSLKNEQEKQIQKMQAAVDSTKAAQQKEVNRIKDSLNKAKEEIDQKIEKLNKGTALYQKNSEQKLSANYTFIMYI
jgi:phage shock protein PspC (stress-responsive transcriptional regulator)